MIVGVLTTSHTQYLTLEIAVYVFFYLKEQHSKFLFHVLHIPELKVRIRTSIETITADMLQTVWNEVLYRVDVCRITKGAHIEQL